MRISKNNAAALVTVIISIFILTILAASMLSLLSNQTRIVEHDIAGTKIKYATEAAMVKQFEQARRNDAFLSQQEVAGKYDDLNKEWIVNANNVTLSNGLVQYNFTVDYSASF